jgi:predicted small lipoprotein YifL
MKRASAILLLALLLAGCGRRGALVPPEGLVPAPVGSLQLMQRGAELELSWTAPKRMESGKKLADLTGFRVLRHEVLPPAEECAACPESWRLLKEISLEYLQGVGKAGDRFLLRDGGLAVGTTWQYRLSPVNRAGASGRAVTTLRRTVRQPLSPPRLKAVATPIAIRLELAVDGLPPGASLDGFTLYRAKAGEALPLLPINAEPVAGPLFEDSGLEQGASYAYSAGMRVTLEGEQLESLLSQPVTASLAEPD